MKAPLSAQAVKALPLAQRLAYLKRLRAQRDLLKSKSTKQGFNLLAFLTRQK